MARVKVKKVIDLSRGVLPFPRILRALLVFGRLRDIAIAASLALAATSQADPPMNELTVLAKSGQLSSNVPGAMLGRISAPSINDAGQVTFLGTVKTTLMSAIDAPAVWRTSNLAPPMLLAEAGASAPGSSGRKYESFDEGLAINDDGDVVFSAVLAGHEWVDSRRGIWRTRHNEEASLIAIAGASAPGRSAAMFEQLTHVVGVDSTGKVAFGAVLAELGGASYSGESLWIADEEMLRLVVKAQQPAPGFTGNVRLNVLATAAYSPAGVLTFFAPLEGDGIDASNSVAMWSSQGAEPTLIFREGVNRFQGYGADADVLGLSVLGMTTDGAVFGSSAIDVGTGGSNFYFMRRPDRTEIEIFALTGDNAPETLGATFDGGFRYAMNDDGVVAFQSFLRTEDYTLTGTGGVWVYRDSSVELVGGAHLPLPGTGDQRFLNLGEVAINNAGQVVFSASVSDDGLHAPMSSSGIWGQDHAGILRLIAQTGSVIDIDSGPGIDFRTIATLVMSPDGFNDRGEIAFSARFTDGSYAALLSNVLAVPEPATAWLVALSSFLFPSFRRRSRRTRVA
jgi:hypothetical protein